MSNDHYLTLIDDLLLEVDNTNLYPQLLQQLQKDIDRAAVNYSIDMQVGPRDLIEAICELLEKLLQDSFNEYLNLLYAVDISETKLRGFTSEKIEDIARYATYLIIKREWQKVWFRNSI